MFVLASAYLILLSITRRTIATSAPPVPLPTPTGIPSSSDFGPEDFCSEYADCAQSGKEYLDKLKTVLQNPSPTDNWPDGSQLFDKYYDLAIIDRYTAGNDVAQESSQPRISPPSIQTKYAMASILSKHRVANTQIPTPTKHLSKNLFKYGRRHHHCDIQLPIPRPERRTPLVRNPRTKTYLRLLQTRAERILNLKAEVRYNVLNGYTLNVILMSYEARDLPDVDNPVWVKWTEKEQQFLWRGVGGTDNVRGVVWLLNDHVGGKMVREIWTRVGRRDRVGGVGKLDVWVVVGG
ncbi:MAG: hypothetical protein L6R42_006053 [Xanthoria sp. 1 TBL-2021]|nr:MAG: hypothetical protein L6R42_006053 [Xanthoria sp. 1 TBL-2021]